MRSVPWIACLALGCAAGPEDAPPSTSERGYFQVVLTPPAGDFHRGLNAFTVRALDAGGGMVEQVSVRAVMPSHAHEPTSAEPVRQADRWAVSDLSIPMPGRWRIELTLRGASVQDNYWYDVWVP